MSKEKAPQVKKGSTSDEDSNTGTAISAYEFSRMFADHMIEWTIRRRENRLTAEDDDLHLDLRMQAELRNYMGERWLRPKKVKPKKADVAPLKDPSGPFQRHGTQLSLGARKRLLDVTWVKPGRTKRVRGEQPINRKSLLDNSQSSVEK